MKQVSKEGDMDAHHKTCTGVLKMA